MRRALLVLALTACRAPPPTGPPGGPPPAPVLVAPATTRTLPIELTAVGTVTPVATAQLKSLVAGRLAELHFTEGQLVKKDDVLATIDAAPLDAAAKVLEANVNRTTAAWRQAEAVRAQRESDVRREEANLVRDTATSERARREGKRYDALVEKNLVAKEQHDQVKTTVAVTEAVLKADRAAIDSARLAVKAAAAAVEVAREAIGADQAQLAASQLQLSYTRLVAPFDGRTGARLVPVGNLVKAYDENPIVVVTQVRPITVAFSIPERSLPDVLKAQAAGPVAVVVRRTGEEKPAATGMLSFINNTVDATTGTIVLKATFANDDDALWPGQFVEVTLRLGSKTAVTVPTQAVQSSQKGTVVFVVKEDDSAEARPVRVGLRVGGDTAVEGVIDGDRIVVDGQSRLRPGAKVAIQRPAATAPAK